MNKEEKIGMYTRNEIFEHLCENSNIGMLGRSMYDAVMSKIDNLQSQLDIANKKLDKIENKIKCLGKFDGEQCTRSFKMWTADFNEILSIIGDKQ